MADNVEGVPHGERVRIWDNSNIFHEAQRFAVERNEGPNACSRVRINFEAMLRLAHADRPMKKPLAAGSVPPALPLLDDLPDLVQTLCNTAANSL